jgi:hypothetical protein
MSKLMTANILALKNNYVHLASAQNPPQETVDLVFLNAEIDFLAQVCAPDLIPALSAADRVTVEEYKLALITAYNHLLNENFTEEELTPRPRPETAKPDVSYTAYYISLFSGLIVNSVHGFVGANSLLAFAGLANPVLLICTIVASVLNGFSYYLYEGYILKKNLGIPVIGKSSKDYFSTFEQQIELTKQINHKLLSYTGADRFTPKEYRVHANVAARLNSLVVINKNRFSHYDETPNTAVFRNWIVAFGAIMAAGSAFFGTKALIILLAAPIVATPVGMLCIAAAIPLAVIFYLAQRSHKVYKMLNPLTHKFETLNEKFQSLSPKSMADFDRVLIKKNYNCVIVKPKPHAQVALPDLNRRIGLFDNGESEQVGAKQAVSEPRKRSLSC